MPSLIDLTGQSFGRLTVISRAGTADHGDATWACSCVCGGTSAVVGESLRRGKTLSCGCLHREVTAEIGRTRNRIHGMSRTPIYKVWTGMHTRCTNQGRPDWPLYGGRGIKVCPEWTGPGGFERFYSHVGPRPEGMSIDRIDPDGNYEPGNVRWATWKEQRHNRRTNKAA